MVLMRVLLSEPRALLLDEPFSKLDMALRDQIRRLVFSKAQERRLPTLLVTHDARDAEAAGGPLVTLSAPEGEDHKKRADKTARSLKPVGNARGDYSASFAGAACVCI
ncbi:hypothetical protein [Breoghania sp.]|uniref:hypothetical protein n=1 Tax=Breoghania sp. TaxID=2065378 RepID=UPI00320482A9